MLTIELRMVVILWACNFLASIQTHVYFVSYSHVTGYHSNVGVLIRKVVEWRLSISWYISPLLMGAISHACNLGQSICTWMLDTSTQALPQRTGHVSSNGLHKAREMTPMATSSMWIMMSLYLQVTLNLHGIPKSASRMWEGLTRVFPVLKVNI